jgi:adenylyl-sulfate kinase
MCPSNLPRKNNIQISCCYWLTGLPGAGKSTIAGRVCDFFTDGGYRVVSLDGDALRNGLNRDLGFSREDRAESVRRAAEVARLMVDTGLIVVVSLISPYRADREMAIERIGSQRCFEVYVDASPEVCAKRDPKKLYARACAGELQGLTGWDAPYEPPHSAAVHIRTAEIGIEESTRLIEQHYLRLV